MTIGRLALGWFIYFLTNMVFLICMAHIVRYSIMYDEFHFDDVSISTAVVLCMPIGYFLFSNFYLQQKEWQALVVRMGDFEEYEMPPGMEVDVARSDVLVKIVLVLINLPVPYILIYFVRADCPDPEDYCCGFAYSGYFPGCMGRWRPLCAVLDLISAYLVSSIAVVTACFYSQMSEYIIMYLRFFQVLVQKIPTFDNWKERRVHMRRTLKYHQHILELYETYYCLVKNVHLIHVFGTPIVLAIIVYCFLTDFKLQNVGFYGVLSLPLTVVCYIGQRMEDESEAVRNIAYQSIPFDGDLRTAKDLKFLILRSQKTMHTPAESLTFCGYTLFVAVWKTMYSYLAVMRNTMDYNS